MKNYMRIAVSLLALSFSSTLSAQIGATATDREALVRKFVDAFNRQDPDAMMTMMAPNIQWLSIDGEKISSEGSSRDAIGASMKKYFKSCPTCRSSLAGVVATPNRLTAVEIAQWKKGAVDKEQRSVSVYEFSGALISRVYYFPAEQ
jgi:hypothetical protein